MKKLEPTVPTCVFCKEVFNSDAAKRLHSHVRHLGGGLRPLKLPGWKTFTPDIHKRDKPLSPDERRVSVRNTHVLCLTANGALKGMKGPSGKLVKIYIDEFLETYQITPEGKHKKVCGARKSVYMGKEKGGVCLHKAGYGTEHPGFGRCKFHMGSVREAGAGNVDMNSAFLSSFMSQDGHTLAESFKKIHEISSKELFNTEIELRVAYALLDDQLKNQNLPIQCPHCDETVVIRLSTADIDSLRETLHLINTILKTDAEIRSKMIVDPFVVWSFVSAIMDYVMPYVRKDERMEVAEGIFTRITLPLGDRSALTVKNLVGGGKTPRDLVPENAIKGGEGYVDVVDGYNAQAVDGEIDAGDSDGDA